MKPRNEHTSPAIVAKAAALLAASKDFAPGQRFCVRRKGARCFDLAIDDVVSMAASLVTQAADQPKPFTSRAEIRKTLRSLRAKAKRKVGRSRTRNPKGLKGGRRR